MKFDIIVIDRLLNFTKYLEQLELLYAPISEKSITYQIKAFITYILLGTYETHNIWDYKGKVYD